MKKRRMPAHIVLPNGMWRFVKSGTKKAVSTVRRARKIKVRTRRGRVNMARRRHRTSHRRGMLGGAGVSGLAKSALIGIGSAHLAGYVPVNIPYKEEVAGAVGAYMIGGKNIKSAAVGAGAVFLTKMLQNNTGMTSSGNY